MKKLYTLLIFLYITIIISIAISVYTIVVFNINKDSLFPLSFFVPTFFIAGAFAISTKQRINNTKWWNEIKKYDKKKWYKNKGD